MKDSSLTALGVRRPVLMTVVNLLIVIAGIAAFLGIKVRELPNVDRPIVSVRATYLGASPETMDAEVTRVIEGAIARVSGIRHITSSSEENNTRIEAEFRVGVDLDTAANDVREAVSRIEEDLPEDVEQLTVIKAEDEGDDVLQLSALSNSLDQQTLAERLEKDIVPALVSVDGVADVRLDGQQRRVMRVELDPIKMAAFQMSIDEVVAALTQARFDIPAGSFESDDQELLVRADASLVEPASLEQMQLGQDLRLADIGQVFFAPEEAESYSLLNGRMVTSIGVIRQAGSNTINISNNIRQRVAEINDQARDFSLVITNDRAEYIRGALFEVIMTLVVAIVIVLVVIAVFLGSIKATIIPAVTMPIALIGTLAMVWLLGFSINLLTLLAFVLATGLVVDDAIVVLENIQRCRNQGEKNIAAAVIGTHQVFFAVIATTLTLVAVFVPIAFLTGQTGRLFREFAIVLAIAVSISSFVALTLCPMMAAKLLGNPKDKDSSSLKSNRLNAFGNKVKNSYLKSLQWLLHKPWLGIVIALVISTIGFVGLQFLNQELVPQEDRGQLQIMLTGPDGASLAYADRQAVKVSKLLAEYQAEGLVTDILSIVGRWDKNRVFITVQLKDWANRDITQMKLAERLDKDLKDFSGANMRIIQASSLSGRRGGEGFGFALIGNDYDTLLPASEDLARKLEDEVGLINDAEVQFDLSQPELSFKIDRQAASDLQVPLARISQTLRIMVDRFELLDLSIDDLAVPIVIAPAGGVIENTDDLLNIFVSNTNNQLIPLESLVTVSEQGIAAELDRHAQRRAIEINLGVAPKAPIGDLVQDIRRIAKETLPQGINVQFLGEGADLEEANYDLIVTFGIALLVVFLVLAAQFESFGCALIVIFTVPFGLAAAVFTLLLTGQTLNIYSQIGLVMLIGLLTKNAILLIEFMEQKRDAGSEVMEAVMTGAEVRFRPVIMTVLATVLGAVPLVISQGPGAEARSAIGWVIVGGLGLSTLITLYLAPLGYRLMAPYVKVRAHAAQELEQQMQ